MNGEPLFENNYVVVAYFKEANTLFCQVKAPYIPMADFQLAFNKMGTLVEEKKMAAMVFDKSNLATFHQPSMEWYHVHWKEKMYPHGLKTYRKVLPKNEFFVQSVQIGRDRIRHNNPSFDFDKYDIQYFDTLAAALAN